MTLRNNFRFLITLVAMLGSGGILAEGLDWNLLSVTPVGSWQLREDITTNHKGKQIVSVTRTSLLAEEMRDEEKYLWMEMSVNTFKIKKDKRKKTGDQSVIKALIPAGMMSSDPANAMRNLRSFGKEIIIQSGDNDPMIIREAGGFADSLLKGMGTEINYDFQVQGKETVSVPAGKFDSDKLVGSGTTTVKVAFKTLNITSDFTGWYSKKVPFGLVKSEGSSVTNGKTSTHSSQVIEFGMSGAISLITKTPQEMPELPNMKDLFGGSKQ